MVIRSAFTASLFVLALTGASFAQTAVPTAPAKPASPPAATSPAKATSVKPATLLDVNTAPKAELEKLKGVGPARADAIIKGRPYKGKDELVAKKILPQNVYNDIKDAIIARQKN